MSMFRTLRLVALATVSLIVFSAAPALAKPAPFDDGPGGAATSTSADTASGGLGTWAGISIGAASALAVVLLVSGVAMTVRHVHERHAPHTA